MSARPEAPLVDPTDGLGRVSSRLLSELWLALARHGIPPRELLGDLPIEVDEKGLVQAPVHWDHFNLFLQRLERHVDGPEGLERCGEWIGRGRTTHAFRAMIALATSPLSLYRAAAIWAAPRAMPGVSVDVIATSPNHLAIDVRVPDPLGPCTPVLHVATGIFRTLPRLLGMPDAVVESRIEAHRAHYAITVPSSRTGLARLRGGQALRATDVSVPADFSSAAFFIVAASLVPGSELLLRRVGMNPRRTGLLHVLRLMGAEIVEENAGEQGGEPVADLRVRHAPLRGIEVPVAHVPDMIDEFPALFVAAACASGATVVRGAAELRVKESDRIATMATGLRALGIVVDETPDGATIHGGALHGGAVESHGDHRIAMAFAVAAQLADGEVRIGDVANVATSFPGFDGLARVAGMQLDAG